MPTQQRHLHGYSSGCVNESRKPGHIYQLYFSERKKTTTVDSTGNGQTAHHHHQGRPNAYPATQNASPKSLGGGGTKIRKLWGNTVLLGHSTVPLPFQ